MPQPIVKNIKRANNNQRKRTRFYVQTPLWVGKTTGQWQIETFITQQTFVHRMQGVNPFLQKYIGRFQITTIHAKNPPIIANSFFFFSFKLHGSQVVRFPYGQKKILRGLADPVTYKQHVEQPCTTLLKNIRDLDIINFTF